MVLAYLIKKFLRENLSDCLSSRSGVNIGNGTEVIGLAQASSLFIDWDTMTPNA